MSECDQQRADIDRCQREIAAIEARILAGHPDLRGLCLALADWSGELRLLQGANEATETARLAPVCDDLPEVGPVTLLDASNATWAPRLAHVRSCGDGLLTGRLLQVASGCFR